MQLRKAKRNEDCFANYALRELRDIADGGSFFKMSFSERMAKRLIIFKTTGFAGCFGYSSETSSPSKKSSKVQL